MTDRLTPADIDRVVTLLSPATPADRPTALPQELRPLDWTEGYALQDAVIARMGPVVGWKVGATAPEAEPFRGAITASTLFDSPARLRADDFNVVGVEAELAYRIGSDLPPRDRPYTTEEVAAAIISIHAAIEIIDTRFAVWGDVHRMSQTADRMNHGALIVGSGRPDWASVEPTAQPVAIHIGDRAPIRAIGGNSAGHPLRMLVWLANVGARSLGGLRAGQVVTTGSCTGTVFVAAGIKVIADFPGVGTAELVLV